MISQEHRLNRAQTKNLISLENKVKELETENAKLKEVIVKADWLDVSIGIFMEHPNQGNIDQLLKSKKEYREKCKEAGC